MLLLITFFAAAETKTLRLAMLDVENLSMDPRADYIEGIIRGLLLFDLSGVEGIEMVDRVSLEKILKEQELQLGSLVNQSENAAKVGKILGAQYLIKGEYVFLGDEVMVNIHILNVESSKLHALSSRGRTENLIHGLAEDIIEILTGNKVALKAPEHERSIISLKDEKPGSLTLHCYMVKAEVYIDEVFKGFTLGDEAKPQVFENLKPGKHTIRIYGWGEYGVIKEPEISFHDWTNDFDLKPGENLVLRAKPKNYAFMLYDLIQKASVSYRFDISKSDDVYNKQEKIEFTDREGKAVKAELNFQASWSAEKGISASVEFVYNSKKHDFSLAAKPEEKAEEDFVVEKLTLQLELDFQYDYRAEISYRIIRNDLQSDMWRK